MNRASTLKLLLLGTASCVVYWFIFQASSWFELNDDLKARPILRVLALFGAAFFAYFAACFLCLRKVDQELEDSNPKSYFGTLTLVILFGIAFRALLLFSIPIQEVDIYRYVWDGIVSNAEVDPYAYPPSSVQRGLDHPQTSELQAPNELMVPIAAKDSATDGELERLIELARTEQGVAKVLGHVHFSQLTTPYPPFSQFVFAKAVGLAGESASEQQYLFTMKSTIILFDVLTGFVVVILLWQVRLPLVWSVGYWWCPLLMKEFANSGHLDSIAVFFSAAAMSALIACSQDRCQGKVVTDSSRDSWVTLCWMIVSALLLALAAGAKLYPVVMVPLWLCACFRWLGWRFLFPGFVFGAVCLVVCWPFLAHTKLVQDNYSQVVPTFAQSLLPLPSVEEFDSSQQASQAGIDAFMESWEMNDLIFMIVVENLKLEGETNLDPWFSFLGQETRARIRNSIGGRFPKMGAFFITRMVTTGLFGLIVLWSMWRFYRRSTAEELLQLTFLTYAWFWLLSPTQNPWYWSWALPFVVFVRMRTWLLISMLTMLYYVRFYFQYHYPPGTELTAFDHYFPWYEFGPVMVILFCEWCFVRRKIQ